MRSTTQLCADSHAPGHGKRNILGEIAQNSARGAAGVFAQRQSGLAKKWADNGNNTSDHTLPSVAIAPPIPFEYPKREVPLLVLLCHVRSVSSAGSRHLTAISTTIGQFHRPRWQHFHTKAQNAAKGCDAAHGSVESPRRALPAANESFCGLRPQWPREVRPAVASRPAS